MTINVPLTWQSSSQIQGSYVAVVQLNALNGTDYNLPLNSSVVNKDGNAIEPHYLTVDNVLNNANVTVSFGPWSFVTPPYVRLTYTLPDNTNNVTVNVPTGLVFITLSEQNVNADTQNQLLINQTSVRTLIYNYNAYNVTTNQSSDDVNSNTNFNPVVADMVYSLMLTANGVGNGWTQWIKNTGSKNVLVTPMGGDTINGIWSAATPLRLSPGDGGLLTSDGVNWYFSGRISVKSTPTTLSAALGQTTVHNFFKRPDIVALDLTCQIANQGYVPGDIVSYSFGNASLNVGAGIMVYYSAGLTDVSFKLSAANVIILNKTTGAAAALVLADWQIQMTATAFYYGG